MNLDIDRQTLNDLAIFESAYNSTCVFNLFNETRTIGGREKLDEIFKKPLIEVISIEERIQIFNYLYNNNIDFTADKNACDFGEFYLKKHYYNKSFPFITGFIEKIIFTLNNNSDYYTIQKGVESVLSVISNLLIFANSDPTSLPGKLKENHFIINNISSQIDFVFVKQLITSKKLSGLEIAKADHFFRQQAFDRLRILFDIVYELDVYQSVSFVGKKLKFSLPIIITDYNKSLILKGLFHPLIKEPVPNNIEFNTEKNICFITGTNMAGKSTLLKAIGICIYLSQIGFPVPASNMQTSVLNGLITTINLPDDVEKGHSHFYAEVLRIKQVAQKINSSGNYFVIFDELFRGTNFKDAYDASLAIISAFAMVKNCFFIVSTHIVEVAQNLTKYNNIDFRYMETVFSNDMPVNNYCLKNGITQERIGMWMVKNEGIIELIETSMLRQIN